ncbi:MAG: hypothetical protein GWO24_17345, partial [Akkermansiaceae bacterium]|nr:hypothetical protein [Akkermansiaceae bacterium]
FREISALTRHYRYDQRAAYVLYHEETARAVIGQFRGSSTRGSFSLSMELQNHRIEFSRRELLPPGSDLADARLDIYSPVLVARAD